MPAELAEYFPDLAEVAALPPAAQRRADAASRPTGRENYVRPELAARIDLADLARWPMTKVLRDVVGVRISRITDTVEARLADPETARAAPGPAAQPDPALHGRHLRRRTAGWWTWRVIHYRGDRFSFTVTLDAT